MSNYVKATDFASKDALLTGDPLKIVSGTEINDEYNAIQTAVNTKADINSPALTGTPTAPTAAVGTSSTQIATTNFATVAIRALYPVGTIYTNASNGTNPATLLGFGTWVVFGAGRVMVSLDSSNSLMDSAEETGGTADSVVVEHNHTADAEAEPDHFHNLESKTGGGFTDNDESGEFAESTGRSSGRTTSAGGHDHAITIDNEGVSGTNQNYQPYITVYMWKRTA